MIEKITNNQKELALILRKEFFYEGIKFLTPDNYSQQLGYMNRPKGYVISPHIHKLVTREVHYTNEVLFIKSGKVRVDFYCENQVYIESRILFTGDILLLVYGGHGFEMLEPTEIIEVKQGPYIGEGDKLRFKPIKNDTIIVNIIS